MSNVHRFPYVLSMRACSTLVVLLAVGLSAAQSFALSSPSPIPGAAGNGLADDTSAIQSAINQLTPGATLNFGGTTFTYLISSTLVLAPGVNYTGTATILMKASATPGTPMMVLNYGRTDNTTITGITLNASGVGGGVLISVNGLWYTPARNVTIANVIFRNTRAHPTGAGDDAIYDPVGLQNSVIAGNSFFNCGGGINVADAANLYITNNRFDTITQDDAIFLVFPANPFSYGNGITISGNTGRNLSRMAIELWSPVPSPTVVAPVISNNVFSGWSSNTNADTGFGISVMAGIGALVQNNSLSGLPIGLGIELGVPNSTVQYNNVSGFGLGLAMYNTHDSQIQNNTFYGQSTAAICFSSGPTGSHNNIMVSGNTISEPQRMGIWINAPDWNGTSIIGNFITRTGGLYPADNYSSFLAINPWPNPAVSVTNNYVAQIASNPPAGFSFTGISINGSSGSNYGSHYDNNQIKSNSYFPAGVGIAVNEPGAASGATFTQNLMENLVYASNGGSSAPLSTSTNRVVNCQVIGPLFQTF